MKKKAFLIVLASMFLLTGCDLRKDSDAETKQISGNKEEIEIKDDVPEQTDITEKTDVEISSGSQVDNIERTIIKSVFINNIMEQEIENQRKLLINVMGEWVLSSYYYGTRGYGSEEMAEECLRKKLEICCEQDKAYILFENNIYDFRYSRQLFDWYIVEQYGLATSLASENSDDYMGKGGIYEMFFEGEESNAHLLLNGEGDVYCRLDIEIAGDSVFVLEKERDALSLNENLEREYFQEKYLLLSEQCYLYSSYQKVEVFEEGVIVDRLFDMLSLDGGIEIYEAEDNIILNVDGRMLRLEDVREIEGIYNPWTMVYFRVPEENAVLYIFRGDNCEVHITAVSNGTHYIKILGNNYVGDIYM
ncbi:MAG: hypothetical protein HDR26_00365 [Lachnospiraceae bacterium]|nr:hypothetical protein [Lachnospiraceae bacterium]